jgi:hypothetical protein
MGTPPGDLRSHGTRPAEQLMEQGAAFRPVENS